MRFCLSFTICVSFLSLFYRTFLASFSFDCIFRHKFSSIMQCRLCCTWSGQVAMIILQPQQQMWSISKLNNAIGLSLFSLQSRFEFVDAPFPRIRLVNYSHWRKCGRLFGAAHLICHTSGARIFRLCFSFSFVFQRFRSACFQCLHSCFFYFFHFFKWFESNPSSPSNNRLFCLLMKKMCFYSFRRGRPSEL